jgi:hypothetical protein
MKPKPHVIEGRESEETRLAENQTQFQTLPTLFFRDHEGFHALSAWEFEDDDELREFIATRTLYVSQLMPEGDAPRPILPSVYAPEIPARPADEPRTSGGEGSERIHFEPVIFEFRLVALDRQSGNPVSGVEGGARLYIDLTTLAAQFTPSGAPTDDPTEIIDRHLETLSRVLATAYGADVYCRLYGGASDSWKVTEGALDNGAHARRTIRAANAGTLPDEVQVAALDVAGCSTVAEAIRFMKALRDSFEPPFRLVGFSSVETPAAVSTLGDVITDRELQTVPEVVAHFRTMLRPRGDYCLLVAAKRYTAAEEGDADAPAHFLLDLRLFEKARSN